MSVREQKLHAQFKRLHLSEQDFREAEDYLSASANEYGATVQRALLLSAVVAYARPFSDNDKNKDGETWATSNVAIKVGKELSLEERGLHERLLVLRNTALAHSDYSVKPHDLRTTSEYGFVVSGFHFDILQEHIDISIFQSACAKLTNACRSKKIELNAAIFHLRNAA